MSDPMSQLLMRSSQTLGLESLKLDASDTVREPTTNYDVILLRQSHFATARSTI